MLADAEGAPITVISQACSGNSLAIQGTINGTDCKMTLDTGASRTIVNPNLVKTATGHKRRINCRLLTASGQPIPVLGETSVTMYVGGSSYSHNVIVAEIVDDCILGLDFMKKHNCKINVADGVFKCGEEEIFILGGACGKVACAKKVIIPGRAEAQVLVELPPAGKKKSNRCVLIEDTPTKTSSQKLMTARTLVSGSSNAVVRVLNLGDREICLNKGDVIGKCEEVVWMKKCSSMTGADSAKSNNYGLVTELLDDCKSNLTYSQSMKAKKFLQRYANIFSSQEGDLGRTSMVQHRIDTGSERPIRQRARRIPIAKEKEVEGLLEDMRRNKIIEPSKSPWCSPVVLVKKKDGSTRFCVDYRRLNDVTKKDSYPLPRIDDTLDTLSGMKWFSTLDLKSGYWQVEIHPKDKEKTAFSTGKGLWQFNVMPFGLCNAPATFERLMECVLAGLVGEACLVYLDDVIIVGRDFEDHLRNLEKVFAKIEGAKLKLNPKKCRLFRSKVNYLGHIISSDGIQTDPEKLEAVQKWPTPKDKTEVRAFLGLCSYYRRFVKGFAEIAKPLHRLTEDKRQFSWDGTCEDSFQKLKKHLCETPILGYPQTEGQFIVDTDASNTAIGGVLSQKQGEREVVIAYFSKSLSKPERNYCVTRRELLAVVKTLQHFNKYLIGRQFLLRTDHAALKWLLQFKNPEGQVARWIEQLQEYDFKTEHRSGKTHGNADALSRRPCSEDCKHCVKQECNEVTLKLTRTNPLSLWENDAMREAQEKDDDLRHIITWKKRGDVKPIWSEVAPTGAVTKAYWAQWDSLILQNGILYRKWEKTNGREFHLQIIVPRTRVPDVLREIHDGVSGGHLGVKRTLTKVRERFYWLHCRDDVQDWCRKCTTCAAVKGPQTRSRGNLRLYNVGAPWERIAVDVAGPFPVTDSGNKYFMVVMDYFTKWPEVFAIPNQEATTVASKLVEEVICRFGVPLEIHSDQGRNFESQVFQEVCRILGMHKTRTTAYHPQSDGMVERFNQTLERHLAKLVDDKQKDWDKYIPLFLLSYRTAEHESIKATPAYVNFGRELRIPVDLLTGGSPEGPKTVQDYVCDLREKMRYIHALVRENGLQSSENMKTRYDRKSNTSGFEEGSLVWLHNPTRRKGKSPKLQNNWDGPYKVVTRLNDVTYRIQKQPRGTFKVVHIDRLARYHGSNNDARDEHL